MEGVRGRGEERKEDLNSFQKDSYRLIFLEVLRPEARRGEDDSKRIRRGRAEGGREGGWVSQEDSVVIKNFWCDLRRLSCLKIIIGSSVIIILKTFNSR